MDAIIVGNATRGPNEASVDAVGVQRENEAADTARFPNLHQL